MNLAFDAKRYFNNGTGLGFYSRTLLNGLRQFYPEHQYALYSPYNKGHLGRPNDIVKLPDNRFSKTFHPLWRSKGITRQLKQDGIELFHGLSHELPLGLKRAGIKSVVTMHDLIFMRYPDLYASLDRYLYKKKYRQAAMAADQVVAISEQTSADLQQYFDIPAAQIQVIGQSCDREFEKLSLRHEQDRFVYASPLGSAVPVADYLMVVGSITPRKNLHRLFDALYLLKNEGLDFPLLVVGTGKGAYADALLQQAKDQALNVYWLNRHFSTTDLAKLYRRALALVYPSVFEGFGIPILEALTIGIPVVTSTGSCFEEVGGNAALYANPLDTEAIAHQLRQLTDSAKTTALVANAGKQIQLFEPKAICATWMDLYARLLAG